MAFVRGIDVSAIQDPDKIPYELWYQLGYRYAYYRVSIGNLPDTRAVKHRAGFRAAGFLTGPYHALHECCSPTDQAKRLIGGYDPTDELPAWADIERPGLSARAVWTFFDYWDANTARTAWIYTGVGAWSRIIPPSDYPRYAKYGLAAADYGFVDLAVDRRSDPPPGPLPRLPKPWADKPDRKFEMWQYAGDNGRLPGYAGAIDLSLYNGTEQELLDRFKPAVTDATLIEIGKQADIIRAATLNMKGLI